jgi:single-strand DNA-binding protein
MLDSATLTITGNVVADPKVTGAANQPDRVTFRVISNRRRRDTTTGEWKQVGEFGINVVCWRRLARGVAQALRKGDPVVVIGQLTERSFVGDDQQTHWRTELTADYVGHDLSLGYADRFNRFTQIDASAARRQEGGAGQVSGEAPNGDAMVGDAADTDGSDSSLGEIAPTAGFDDVSADVFDSDELVATAP